jgi:hypothetical protein
VRSYVGGTLLDSKIVETRTEFDGREVVTEVVQVPGVDSKFEPQTKTTTETTGIGSDSVKIMREVFRYDGPGRFTRIETTVTDQQKLPDGTSRITTNSWTPDVNGHLNLSYRRVQVMKNAAPDVWQGETIFYSPGSRYVPGVDEALTGTERIRTTERRLGPNLVQSESYRDVRDVNGRWQPIEARNQEVHTISDADVVEEETVRLLDGSGKSTLSQRTITRRSRRNDSDQVVTEIYSRYVLGEARDPDSPLVLDRRIRVTTTPDMKGGSQTISETESRAPSSANGPIQVVKRTVDTVRQIGPDAWETQRQTFELDGSGKLVLAIDERGERRGK